MALDKLVNDNIFPHVDELQIWETTPQPFGLHDQHIK